MILPSPPRHYDQKDQSTLREQIRAADLLAHKRNRDIEVGDGRVILTSANGTRYALTVSNAGALSTVAI